MLPQLTIFFSLSYLVLDELNIYSVIRCNKKAEKRVEISYPILNLNTIGGLFLFFVLTGLTIILAYVGQVAFIYGKF